MIAVSLPPVIRRAAFRRRLASLHVLLWGPGITVWMKAPEALAYPLSPRARRMLRAARTIGS